MNRQLSEQELQEIFRVQDQLREQGLIVDDVDGKEEVDQNAERISAYFDLNRNIPVTTQTVLTAVKQMRSQMRFKSAPQIEYEKEYAALTKNQQDAFGSWWHSQGRVLVLEGDQGFENAAQIISWMRGKTFDARGFDLAVSNLAASSRRGLHWARTPQQAPSGRPGHAPSGSFAPKSETNLSARDHAKRAAEAAAGSRISEKPGTDYRKLSEEISGATHSQTEQIRKLFITEGRTINWEQTFYARRRMAGIN